MSRSRSQICVQPTHLATLPTLPECAPDLAHQIRMSLHHGDTHQARTLLLDARSRILPGEWHRWVEEWICITPRRAQQIMKRGEPPNP